MTYDDFPDQLRRLAGIRDKVDEAELPISVMKKIVSQGKPDDLDARLRFASAQNAIEALERLAPKAREAIIRVLGSLLDREPDIDPEIEVADLLEVVFNKYGTDPDKFVER